MDRFKSRDAPRGLPWSPVMVSRCGFPLWFPVVVSSCDLLLWYPAVVSPCMLSPLCSSSPLLFCLPLLDHLSSLLSTPPHSTLFQTTPCYTLAILGGSLFSLLFVLSRLPLYSLYTFPTLPTLPNSPMLFGLYAPTKNPRSFMSVALHVLACHLHIITSVSRSRAFNMSQKRNITLRKMLFDSGGGEGWWGVATR